MVPGLSYEHLVLLNCVYEAVLLCDSPGPEAGEIVLEWLGFAQALKRITLYISDEANDPFRDLPVVLDPVGKVVPTLVSEDNFHHSSGNSCSEPLPERN